MVLIGVLALLAPNPVWPEWLARLVLSGGIAVMVTVFVAPLVKGRKSRTEDKKR